MTVTKLLRYCKKLAWHVNDKMLSKDNTASSCEQLAQGYVKVKYRGILSQVHYLTTITTPPCHTYTHQP